MIDAAEDAVDDVRCETIAREDEDAPAAVCDFDGEDDVEEDEDDVGDTWRGGDC